MNKSNIFFEDCCAVQSMTHCRTNVFPLQNKLDKVTYNLMKLKKCSARLLAQVTSV